MSRRAVDPIAAFRRVARRSGALWATALALDRISPVPLQRFWRPTRVPASMLSEQLATILRAWGMPSADVATTVEAIVYADLRGIDSHGCCMLPFYYTLLREGSLNVQPTVRVVHEGPATALIDGGGGLGHVPARMAMGHAIDLAAGVGVGVVAVTNSGHFGAAGTYAAQAASRGMIGLVTSSTPTPAVVPTFGRDPRLGTNPLAVCVPAGRRSDFLLDMATSTVSLGRTLERWRAGRRIPRGWALDRRGRPMTNGRTAAKTRRLTPLGGDHARGSHKGYGLAATVEILSALLPGLTAGESPGGRRSRVGHCCVAIDPARFGEAGAFLDRVDGFIDYLHDSRPATPAHPVLVPGDPERETLAERSANGIPLAHAVIEDLREIADACHVPFLLDRRRH